MSEREPPLWSLPGWDAVDDDAAAAPVRSSPASQPPGTFGLRIRTVSEVTRTIKGVVTADERLRDVWVEGEVGRVTVSSAGHAYFALKDERNQLGCVWFRDDRLRAAVEARTGLRVVVHGRIDLYEPTGALQLYVESLQPAGFGDLALRLEALKAQLARDGLFATERKRRLPDRPAAIAVVTSPSAAVWHDIRTVLARRWPLATVVLAPCLVQGDGAAASVAGALARVARLAADGGPDAPAVTIVARGGGSLEDLWSFNDEAVVRAIVAHPVPVVSGIGHEVDTTLADFAADVRAPTPSAAAELTVPDRVEFAAAIRARRARLDALVGAQLAAAAADVATERRALDRLDPRARIVADRETVGRLLDRATRAATGRVDAARLAGERLGGRFAPLLPDRLAAARSALAAGSAALGVLGPQGTLERGYAIVRRADDRRIVRSPDEAVAGTRLRLTVAHGELAAESLGAAGDESR